MVECEVIRFKKGLITVYIYDGDATKRIYIIDIGNRDIREKKTLKYRLLKQSEIDFSRVVIKYADNEFIVMFSGPFSEYLSNTKN